MPKYYDYKIGDYYLYFTSFCIVEAFHVHASDRNLSESGSAKFFVHKDGTSTVEKRGRLNPRSINAIQAFIKINHEEMYQKWLKHNGKPEHYGEGL